MTAQQLNVDLMKNSKLKFNEDVIAKIAGMAIQDIDGILSMNGNVFDNLADKIRSKNDITKGIDVDVGEKQTALDLEIILEYGKDAHRVFENILQEVSAAIESMTGLKVIEINVYISDVMTKKEWQRQNKSNDNNRVN
ncbi:Asp23/Gls24 family envelope stress response protein [Companilactobacillus alimentarius]|uniref:Stress response regulator gls24 homolog n=1 Tax=Companilactobacillus alimentarius DSM 20249 TaxID=1423720 RepID=A0A2K9HKF6_9LACO|nr:Asp23/Gls24 family envelope stress response protein [Companilactobacillus alimentarius]AUI72267.1 alkaline-shock protein [Companilactobacillus alimentarius DSM 20249]KRK77510.1 general stress protein [Companilactobacillus alimentarius DSM 20249]MDT6952838.1 Asp23/Gls24 family envelope stress response protein [Companilactobacillus alimentarius]GEO45491.1 alkaline-shock protein [Companilactobacillus alimentarius]